MKKFKITFGLVQAITGKNHYQLIRAYGVKQTDDFNLNLFVENLVVGNLYFQTGIISVEQVPFTDVSR